MYLSLLLLGLMLVLTLALANEAGGKPTFRKPPPAEVLEFPDLDIASLVELKDGSLLASNGRRSPDGGRTWSEPCPLAGGLDAASWGGFCRLQSATLAVTGNSHAQEPVIWLSSDEGQSFGEAVLVDLLGMPYYDTMIQLKSGRLLYPSRICFGNAEHPGLLYEEASSWGTWRGRRLQIAGHYHYPEIDIACVSYSDDEGQTWQQCEGKLMGWFDADGIANGFGGVTACDEPGVAECADGRILFLARSTVGRLVQSYSSDGGEIWTAVRPSELASSYSPPRLRTIPQTGDLLCVWNQCSREEIRRGYRRGRLSAAISKDSGATWQSFKSLEVSEGIEDVDRISPEYPTTPVIGLPDVGQVPDGFATFDYANVCFAGDQVYVIYHRSWVAPAAGEAQAETLGERIYYGTTVKPAELVLRIYPLEWFYQ